jgi:hypothetical protein
MKRYRNILLAVFVTAAVAGGNAAAQDGDQPSPPPDPCPVEWSDGNGLFVGMVSDQLFADPDPEYRRCTLNKHAEAGVRIIRQALLWKEIEPRRDTYDWEYWDQYVADVASHGITLMPIIFDAPRWRQQRRPRPDWGAMPPKPHAIASFAARLVRRYGPDGSFWRAHADLREVPIRVWQVWNEPNLPRYWAQQPVAAEYVEILRAAHDAIKAEDPGAQVVAAGMPDSKLWHAVPLYEYITQMYLAGGRGSFDALAVNAYAETPTRMMRNLGQVRRTMRAFRDRARIWITELGWGTGGPRYRFRVNRSQQARYLGQALRKLRDARFRLGIRGFIHYMWQDAEPYGTTPDFWGLHTGLLDMNGDEKPAYSVFSRLGRQLRWIKPR